MSDEDFLSRWSRRKREATQSAGSAEQPAAPDAAEASPSQAAEGAANQKAEPVKAEDKSEEEFDLASLPPIDSITATTDITAFLRKGVPLELSRAALRRAWTSDPAIRDFIGPAENAWDFNDPNAMPGFGPLDQTTEQVREWAARIVGRVRQATDELTSAPAEASPQSAAGDTSAQINERPVSVEPAAVASPVPAAAATPPDDGMTALGASSPPQPASEQLDNAATQKEERAPTLRRTHGGALPR